MELKLRDGDSQLSLPCKVLQSFTLHRNVFPDNLYLSLLCLFSSLSLHFIERTCHWRRHSLFILFFIFQLCLCNDLLLPRVIWTLALWKSRQLPRFRIQLIALQNGSTELRQVFPQLEEILPTTTHTPGSVTRQEKCWEKKSSLTLSFITLSSRGSAANFLA